MVRALWTGVLTAPVSGETCSTFSNDGVRLWIDDTQLMTTGPITPRPKASVASRCLQAQLIGCGWSKLYNGGQGATKLWWTLRMGPARASSSRFPRARFNPPQAVPVCAASISRATI